MDADIRQQIRDYMRERYAMTPEEREARFREIAQHFGKADADTQAYYDELRALGVGAVFSCGMTREQELEVLRSPETQRILRDPGTWKF